MGIFDNVAVGTITYVITFILGPILKWGAQYIYRGATYSDLDISGAWTSNFKWADQVGGEIIKLKQNGYRIRGTIETSIQKINGELEQLSSKIYGEIRKGFLVAYYVPKDRKAFGCGSFTMQLLENGKILKGVCPFQYSLDGSLKTIDDYVWKRP